MTIAAPLAAFEAPVEDRVLEDIHDTADLVRSFAIKPNSPAVYGARAPRPPNDAVCAPAAESSLSEAGPPNGNSAPRSPAFHVHPVFGSRRSPRKRTAGNARVDSVAPDR
jgi:hypothetical protein